ncbi:MAG: CDP-alcohol phosphatidyltransferase family protein [Nocardioidaceae bacterium]
MANSDVDPLPDPRDPRPRPVLAGAVHVYTSLGAVLAFLMIVAAVEDDTTAALWLFLAAMVVDGTDGLLARRLRVKEVIPWFDGALLDNIVDYLTYVFAPVVLLWTAGFLPDGRAGWLLACLPLLVSTYQFCRSDAKTEDHFFMGFPSYWNVVAFYVVVLDLPASAVTTLLVVLSVLVFVPVKYVYPSRTQTWWYTNMAATAAWFVAYAFIVAQLPDPAPWLVGLSLAYVGFYVAESLMLTLRKRQSDRASDHVVGTASA